MYQALCRLSAIAELVVRISCIIDQLTINVVKFCTFNDIVRDNDEFSLGVLYVVPSVYQKSDLYTFAPHRIYGAMLTKTVV